MLLFGGVAARFSISAAPSVRARRSSLPKCNMSAALQLSARVAMLIIPVIFTAAPAVAQSDALSAGAQQNEHVAADTVKFLAGGGLGLVFHESGHLVFDVLFAAKPRVEPVHFGPFPFFAIEHRSDL